MNTTKITIRCGMTRGKDYQSVRYELVEEIDLADGDDRDAIIMAARKRLMEEVHAYAGKALENVVGGR